MLYTNNILLYIGHHYSKLQKIFFGPLYQTITSLQCVGDCLCVQILYINSLGLLVSESWARARTGHGQERDLARTGHGKGKLGMGGLGTGRLGPTRTDWARQGQAGHGQTRPDTDRLGTDWARAGWARADCVRTSQVPTSIVKVSKHDGIKLSKAEATHPSTCPMNFGCNEIRIHKL